MQEIQEMCEEDRADQKERCIDSFCVTRYAAGVGYLSEGNLAGTRKSTCAGRMQESGRVLPERRTGE